ncbi:neutral/alkaline non-lysosomal ceramidase N-terminal domain-containing protein [Rhodococcus sp. G-MC3]|uniref:neutral/alkaline non-lysosomal ceramidase N-terminal domain-containing protein n=1 Tax=Rhodococcus sp. G-MC3 TaxID=3046209 RepID=UPI0024BB2902|nr:neutral/alkaline non-lysosomal ceramidase N-terminal domain-containing protein [Rhodococcus sp. G-MC3]MDJ0392531.1 neutral/alkaline non-lysosomal ceramidase N-terminal domain-containing protein [Rhodococcus sp. G-MC3]
MNRDMRRRTFLTATGAALGIAALSASPARATPTGIDVGRGIGDMTGEPLGAGMNGYAVLEQSSAGLHLRQRARAFVFVDTATSQRLVHVTCEVGLMFESIFEEVLTRLAERYGNLYHRGNVLLSATHTHAAPGGTDGHLLVDITTLGFRPITFESNVSGIVDAIVRAHDDVQPGQLTLTSGSLDDAGVNRSPVAFDRDPDGAQFPRKIDPRSVNLQLERGGSLAGVINWFATHGTSMRAENQLVSTDNKGYAAWHWERAVEHVDFSNPSFVAAFCQSTPGDVTPNLDRQPGTGPTTDEFENTRIIGLRQFDTAHAQTESDGTSLDAGIGARSIYVDFSSYTVRAEFTGDGRTHTTAPAALGAAFAASSQEDGGGVPALGLEEGERGGNPALAALSSVILPQWLREAHAPKDVILPVGLIPGIVQQVLPFHLVRIGAFHLFACPFEPTVVAGARLRTALAETLGIDRDLVVVQGYTNGYGHYLTTPEEYAEQDYEGGATAFGPWQLPATIQIAVDLASALRERRPVEPGGPQRDLTGAIPSAIGGNPFVDIAASGTTFGQVQTQPAPEYGVGQQVVVRFSGANPNSNLRRDDTYLAVERFTSTGWVREYDDGDWYTKILFDNAGPITSTTVIWDIPQGQSAGTYRIVYFGDARSLDGHLTPFVGTSASFEVS